jgi:alkyl sulfatase BDS1-like metallo-beta-lactamase superfamily hydrolase
MVSSDEVFDKIKVRLTKVDPAKKKLSGTYKFVITDDGGAVIKTWILDLNDIKLTLGDGSADATLTLSDKAMTEVGSGALSVADAIAQGKLKVVGNPDAAELLQPFVSSL